MTITIADLETKYAAWFLGMKNTEQAKRGILELFSTEPDDEHAWSEQDIYEQSRKIILKWNETEVHQE
jgi:3'-phosphoadenosine 5'-phosphosulfate sulfotransferase (PAPS reductase)/FAD synthetase